MTESVSPVFSIIVAVYNAQRYLEETLRALSAQTFSAFEVVMVNDGSTDQSAELAQKFCDQDPRFRLFHTPNQGISPTRNLAVQHATAPWIAVCDADDTWTPDKLELQHRFIQQWAATQAEPMLALGTSGDLINGKGEQIRMVNTQERPWPTVLHDEATLHELHMINSSVVFQREVFLRLGGYRAEYTPTEDTDLWVRFSEHGAVINMPDHLTHYRMHSSNISESHYPVMILNLYRIQANTERRRQQLPEWSAEQFTARMRQNRPQYVRTMKNLQHMKYYNRAKNRWGNGHYLGVVAPLVQACLVSPSRTVKLFLRSEVYRTSRLHWRRHPG
ncbi:glycosyltransferase family 2 protein [Deinococcus sp. QL22]|uniref:glycosyltransferase family 2 protein n=1 Tax=Deinococcus sp. QL22 TaxID=2939437 RepID=UPI002017C67C|nr:glycosyltransferase family 2 protein [Deinococcus sp. QL22]UQN09684.1 glycosyltransferase [Deinococcus sp. QL22]